ncbi:MAG: hypothetical protein ACLROS_00275 [Faecalibacterium sp.]
MKGNASFDRRKKMDIILVMLAGMVAGHFFFPKALKKVNEKIQLLCTLCLIFSMGVMLGRKENFLQELTSMGIVSFLFFLIPTALSILLVYYLTKRFLKKK